MEELSLIGILIVKYGVSPLLAYIVARMKDAGMTEEEIHAHFVKSCTVFDAEDPNSIKRSP
jgi:hypothetical protein